MKNIILMLVLLNCSKTNGKKSEDMRRSLDNDSISSIENINNLNENKNNTSPVDDTNNTLNSNNKQQEEKSKKDSSIGSIQDVHDIENSKAMLDNNQVTRRPFLIKRSNTLGILPSQHTFSESDISQKNEFNSSGTIIDSNKEKQESKSRLSRSAKNLFGLIKNKSNKKPKSKSANTSPDINRRS